MEGHVFFVAYRRAVLNERAVTAVYELHKEILTHTYLSNIRLFWVAVWSCTLCGAVSVILSNWDRFQQNPTVISMDKNFMDFNTTFPAMTACQYGIYNKTRADAFISKQWGNVTPEKREYYHSFLEAIANISYDNLAVFKKFVNDNSLPQGGYYQILTAISETNRDKREGIEAMVGPQMGPIGLCYTINSAFLNYVHDRRKLQNNGQVKIQDVLVKPHTTCDKDGVAWMSVIDTVNVTYYYMHSPYEFPDVTTHGQIALLFHLTSNTFKALELVATPGLKMLDIQQRRCRFPEESDLEISTTYSYTLCRTQCRMKLARKLCGCSPFFYPLVDGYPECSVSGLVCLSRYKEHIQFITDPVTNKPDKACTCMTPCNVVSYTVIASWVGTWDESTQYTWQMFRTPRVQLQRSVLYGPVDLLVSFGGTVGFFLGCSLLSGVEVIYFYTLRLIWFVIEERRKNKKLKA